MKTNYSWSAPSNIAFVKYWGKKGVQEPLNSNLSGTLDKCRTNTSIIFEKGEFDVTLFFHGERNETFEKKVRAKLAKTISNEFPSLLNYKLTIHSENTFPHSCGIASSASFYASLSLCLTEFEFELSSRSIYGESDCFSTDFLERASFYARLGSGSACRSLFPGVATWEFESPAYAKCLEIKNDNLKEIDDFICLVDSSEKSVSSTLGHSMMNDHPYKDLRINQANQNFSACVTALQYGDWNSFIQVVEEEANSLHALMMTSRPAFILLKPNTLAFIESFQRWREEHQVNACYTIDAGPNLHFLVDRKQSELFKSFIEKNTHLLENGQYIHDQIGGVIKKIEHI